MSENEVKKAFNAIEPEDGTRERMYANILKKAAAQRAAAPEENADAPAAESNASPKTVPLPARRPTPRWKRYSAMAACLALVTTLTIGFLHPFFAGDSEGNEPPVLGGSPFEDVQSAADLEEKLGFVIDAPEGAENVTYCIYDGEIACVDFTLDGHEYTYEAAKLDGASDARVFFQVVLPMSKPILVYTIISSFMVPWTDFVMAKMILNSGVSADWTVAIGLYNMLQKTLINNYFALFCAGGVLVSIPISILFVIMQKFYVEGITSGADKG